jgi:hypothetical protein
MYYHITNENQSFKSNNLQSCQSYVNIDCAKDLLWVCKNVKIPQVHLEVLLQIIWFIPFLQFAFVYEMQFCYRIWRTKAVNVPYQLKLLSRKVSYKYSFSVYQLSSSSFLRLCDSESLDTAWLRKTNFINFRYFLIFSIVIIFCNSAQYVSERTEHW